MVSGEWWERLSIRLRQGYAGTSLRIGDPASRGYAGTSFEFLIGTRKWLFQAFRAACVEQGPHLGDGDVVEGGEAFGLWQSLADEDGVEAFEVGEDDELLQRGVVG